MLWGRETLGGTLERIIDEMAADMGVADNAFSVAEDIIKLVKQSCMLTSGAATLDLRLFFSLHSSHLRRIYAKYTTK